MKKTCTPFKAQIGRYQHLRKKVVRLLKSGSFQLLSVEKRKRLLTDLQARLKRIAHLMPQPMQRGAFASLALLFTTGLATEELQAQTFSPAISNPFGISGSVGGYHNYADIDGDGDLDQFINTYNYSGYQLYLFENTGSPSAPLFAADDFQVNPYGITSEYLSQPVLLDIDDDGDLDLISGHLENGGFVFQENIGTATAPSFSAAITNPFGLASVQLINFVTSADLDGDGDKDLLGGGFFGQLQYFENTGSATAPMFAAPVEDPFGIEAQGQVKVPNLCDLDGDGDFDLLYMVYENSFDIWYSENTGSATAPSFAAGITMPFGIGAGGLEIPIPSSADIDSDGDVDVFITDYYSGGISFYENLNINVEYPPTASDNSVTMDEDGLYIFNQLDFNFTDANVSDLLSAVQITELPTKGVLKLGSTNITLNQIIGINELSGFLFDSDLNENGADYANFKFKVYDGELWSMDDYTMTINVEAVNDIPTSAATSIVVAENESFSFDESIFPYSDVEGTDLGSIKIVTLPAKGSLKLGANNVAAGQTVAAGNISNLTYTPLMDEFGMNYTSFNFQVFDGSAFSTTNTLTINVEEGSSSSDVLFQTSVKISPNPAADLVNVHVESAEILGKVTLALFDESGRLVLVSELESKSQLLDSQINISGFAVGNYFLKIQTERGVNTAKIIKG